VEQTGGTMKIEIEDNSKPTFKPFTLKIDVESKEELALLWCALNMPPSQVREHNDGAAQMRCANLMLVGGTSSILYKLWDVIDDIWRDSEK
jgi:hypothetical protein